MEWLEIIELRSTVLNNNKLKYKLTGITEQINSELGKGKIKLFSSNTIVSDFCIHIKHFSKSPIKKSRLGRQVHMALKKFGMTNHKVWVQIENED